VLPPDVVTPTIPPENLRPTFPPEGVVTPTVPPGAPGQTLPGTVPQTLPGGSVGGQAGGAPAAGQALDLEAYCNALIARANLIQQPVAAPIECLRVQRGGRDRPPPPKPWNVSMDVSHYDISDHRYGLTMEGRSTSVTVSADKSLRGGLIAGFNFGYSENESELFNGHMEASGDGFSLGGYLTYISPGRWIVDGSLTWSQTDNDLRVLVLEGEFESRSLSASMGVSGQYNFSGTMVRPRVSLNYAFLHSDAYDMTGSFAGFDLNLDQAADQSGFGTIRLNTEISHVYVVGRLPIMPYAEFEATWAFDRPNNGDMLTADLTQVGTSSIYGAVRGGVRVLVTPETMLTLSGAYDSVGQNGLDVWGLRFYLSRRF
jgi:outer membrane autotransporter protein